VITRPMKAIIIEIALLFLLRVNTASCFCFMNCHRRGPINNNNFYNYNLAALTQCESSIVAIAVTPIDLSLTLSR
jgi:hypothetical protein